MGMSRFHPDTFVDRLSRSRIISIPFFRRHSFTFVCFCVTWHYLRNMISRTRSAQQNDQAIMRFRGPSMTPLPPKTELENVDNFDFLLSMFSLKYIPVLLFWGLYTKPWLVKTRVNECMSFCAHDHAAIMLFWLERAPKWNLRTLRMLRIGWENFSRFSRLDPVCKGLYSKRRVELIKGSIEIFWK